MKAAGSLVDYDVHFRRGRGQCGEPFPELVEFLERMLRVPARVLDLGCGQGRDALLAARLGHEVVGVDRSEVGVAQMVEDARAEGLSVTGVVSDVLTFRSRRTFDAVLLDRVLHLLPGDGCRLACLERAASRTRTRGFVFVSDVPKHRAVISGYFTARPETWSIVEQVRNHLLVRKR